MSFVLQAEQPYRAGFSMPLEETGRARVCLWLHRVERHGGALLVTLVVHAALFALLMWHLFAQEPVEQPAPRPGIALLFFDLAGKVSAAPRSPPAKAAPASAVVKDPAPPPPMPAEWRVVPIRVAVPVEVAGAGAPPTAPAAPSATANGTKGFDPYAGAAPRRATDPSMTKGGTLDPRKMPAAFEAIMRGDVSLRPFIEAFMRRHGGASGMAYCRVRLDTSGRIVEVASVTGSLGGDLRDRLRAELVGQRMGVTRSAGSDGLTDVGPMIFAHLS